ncbi:hypothetical protein T459_28855 [Capsicum annuum]|uniref:Uncharacterized protein n=1 Tax=Capsicum annuum TaxID=4072 RepID=A0A2G2YHY6_CAPAN|nr:hypothetical protein T459_28855 [Capsicum annuum]
MALNHSPNLGMTYSQPPIPPLAGPAPAAVPSMLLQFQPIFQPSRYNLMVTDSSGSLYQTQINDHRFPSGAQPWMPISNHNVNSATTMQKIGELAAPLVVPMSLNKWRNDGIHERNFIPITLIYLDDNSQIKDAVRMAEVITTLHFNLCCASFVFEELLERAREKEEKEANKRKRLADDFYELLHASKEITASLKWEDRKFLFGDKQVASFAFIDLELVTRLQGPLENDN